MFNSFKFKTGIKLYSVTLSVILLAFMTWLTHYQNNPENPDLIGLQKIATDLQNLKEENNPLAIETMAWIYPGEPACFSAIKTDKVKLSVVKPEYFIVTDNGELETMTVSEYGCNGYSSQNVAKVKTLARKQFVTVSSDYSKNIADFLKRAEAEKTVEFLVNFVVENNLTGIELDFEDVGGFDQNLVDNYLDFIKKLGNSLHQNQKELMVDLPAVSDKTEEGWYLLKYKSFNNLPVDYIVIMAYDYQYDHGIGNPVSPLTWLEKVILYSKSHIIDENKIVIGLPLYGYVGDYSSGNMRLLTRKQLTENSLFQTLQRDEASKELISPKLQGKILVAQDEVSLEAKIAVVKKSGLNKISLWHLGGSFLDE